MPRKTTILIVILAIVTGILIFFAVRSENPSQLVNTPTSSPSPTTIQPYSTLSFSTGLLDATSGSTAKSVDVIIDTKGQLVSGAQIELSYDPKVLTNVRIAKPVTPFFGENQFVLINDVDPELGRISYAVGININDDEISGRGNVVTLSFTVNRLAGIPATQLTFLTKSAVTSLSTNGSVLQGTMPLQIQILPENSQ